MRAKRINQRGQALVEFSFVAILFFTILFGIIEFGRALWTWNTMVQATRAGARFAVVETPLSGDTGVKNYVVYHNAAGTGTPVAPGLATSNVQVRYLLRDGTDCSSNKYLADLVEVSISSYTFRFVVPLFGSGITMPACKTLLPKEALGAT